MRKAIAALLMATLVSACSTGAGRTPILGPTAARALPSAPIPQRQPNTQPARPSQPQREVGFEGVIGARASVLIGELGKPRIDLLERDARKLQFASENCVIDIFLYPASPGAEPVATHIQARQRAGGASADAGRCLAEIIRR